MTNANFEKKEKLKKHQKTNHTLRYINNAVDYNKYWLSKVNPRGVIVL